MRSKKRNFLLYKQKGNFELVVLVLVLSLCFWGLLMIYDASSVSALNDFGDKLYYVKEQIKWLILGSIGLVIGAFIDYKYWRKIGIVFLVITIILLCLVFIPGLGIAAYGAKRWVNFGLFVLQPAEFAKISLIIYLSAWLSSKGKARFLSFITLLCIPIGLIILEPDLGTSLIIALVSMVIYFISGAPLLHFLLIVPLSIISTVLFAITSPYRLKRLTTFINPENDPLGASYHIRQVLLALGSGGLFGVGIGKSRQKYSYLPEATTDSIFAIIGEEVGFIGVLIFIIVYLTLLYRCYKIALKAPDKFGYLLGMGITFWLSIQALVNISAMTAVFPLTGIPLPFISYGGSGLIMALFSIGILLNISRQSIKKKKKNE